MDSFQERFADYLQRMGRQPIRKICKHPGCRNATALIRRGAYAEHCMEHMDPDECSRFCASTQFAVPMKLLHETCGMARHLANRMWGGPDD